MKMYFLLVAWIAFCAWPVQAQQLVTFPLVDGSVQLQGDLYGKGKRGIVLAHAGDSTKRAGKNRLTSYLRPDFLSSLSVSAEIS